MKTVIIITAVIALTSTLISITATVKTLIHEHNRVRMDQRQINEQVERARQPNTPKVVTTSPTAIQVDGAHLQLS